MLGYDNIEQVRIATDRDTGRPRGFAYVKFSSNEEAQKIFSSGGLEIDGRSINIDYAEDRPQGGGGGGGGDRRQSGGFGGGGGRGGQPFVCFFFSSGGEVK